MTKIEWTHPPGFVGVTWNPVTGCTPISEGCANCYAERMAKRLAGRHDYPRNEPFRVTLHERRLEDPLNWTSASIRGAVRRARRRFVFVCSMGDLFHADVPDAFIDRVMVRIALRGERGVKVRGEIEACAPDVFVLLTKRAERMTAYFTNPYRRGCIEEAPDEEDVGRAVESLEQIRAQGWPLPHLWLGVTAENQRTADERIPLLLETPAAVRFVSVEPCLSPVDITPYIGYNPIKKGECHETHRDGRDCLSCCDCGRAGDRRPGQGMEGESSQGGSMERWHPDRGLQEEAGGTRHGAIPTSEGYAVLGESELHGPSPRVETPQRANPGGANYQSQERSEKGQSPCKSRTGYVLGTDQTRHDSPRKTQEVLESIRGEQSHGEIDCKCSARDSRLERSDPCGDAQSAWDKNTPASQEVRRVVPSSMGCCQKPQMGISWYIVGAETGPGARPMDLDWARSLRDQCGEAGVPFFFKSAGPGVATPEDLRVREWPI